MEISKIAVTHKILFLILFLSGNLYAAAWLQPKGHLLSITNNQIYNSCRYWNKQGQSLSGPCFFQETLQPYFEYGVLEPLTVVINPIFDTFHQSDLNVPFGFENIFFAGRYQLWKKDWSVLSAQVGYNAPIRTELFGNPATPTAVYAIINRMRFIDARILYGTGGTFDKGNYNTWYFDAEAAYQPNFSGASDEIKINFMLGWKTKNGRLVFELQEWNAIQSGQPISQLYPNYSLATIMANIIYWIVPDVAAFQLGLQQDLAGKNIGQGTAPFISFWWGFN